MAAVRVALKEERRAEQLVELKVGLKVETWAVC